MSLSNLSCGAVALANTTPLTTQQQSQLGPFVTGRRYGRLNPPTPVPTMDAIFTTVTIPILSRPFSVAPSSSTCACRHHRAAGSIAGHEDQGPRAGRFVHEVFTMGLGMFFSAQSRKTSNCAKAVDPNMPSGR
jgi:hypothetical protein